MNASGEYAEKFAFGKGIERYRIRVTFNETMLGGAPLDQELYSNYILSKREDFNEGENEEELSTLNEDKGKTGFHRDSDGNPFVYNYHWKGCLKESCQGLSRIDGSLSKALKSYRKLIHDTIFIFPRRIPVALPTHEGMGVMERPLRASTPMGERVALAFSETVPPGSSMDFDAHLWDPKKVSPDILREWLDFAAMRGWGQWRTGGFGTFEYTMERIQA